MPNLNIYNNGNQQVTRLLYTPDNSPNELCSLETAEQCLTEYADQEEINLSRLPQVNIDLFLETVRYAPYEIDLSVIARDCGITPSNYEPEPTIQQVNARTGNGISFRDLDFANFLAEPQMSQPQQIAVSQHVQDMIAEMYRPTPVQERRNLGTLDGYYTNIPTTKKVRKRSEHDMFMEIIRGEDFPRPMFKDWSDRNEMNNIINDWYRSVEYREQWIFSRREREGFNRRNIGNFSLDDVMARISKRRNKHPNDTDNSTFYDWKLGGTDWMLRLELYHHEGRYFLITRHIYKPALAEMKFDVRYWNGNTFKHVGTMFTEQNNTISEHYASVFGTNDDNNPYESQDYYEDEDYEEDYEPDFEDSSF